MKKNMYGNFPCNRDMQIKTRCNFLPITHTGRNVNYFKGLL